MNYWSCSATLAAAFMIAGCQPHPLGDSISKGGYASPRAMALSPTLEEAERISSERQKESPQPKGELSLADVLSLALNHHPRLDAYSAQTRAAEARAIQAGRWLNPVLEVELENIAGSGQYSGIDAAETTISLAQTFPLGSLISRRQELANMQSQQADWEYQEARLEVLLEATQRFIRAVAADRRIELAQQELKLVQATELLTRQRVDAGEASPVESTRVIVPVITAEIALQRTRREQESAYRRLAMMWGSRQATFQMSRAHFDALAPLPSPQQLVSVINDNPHIAKWATQISAHLAQQRLAEAQSRPELTGRVGMKHDNESDDVALVVGISLPLPIFDRRRGEVLAARWEATAARNQQRSAELRLEGMLSASYADLAGAHDEVVALGDRALPAANKALDATQQAFKEGELPFIDVLDAQRTLFELQTRYVDALVVYHNATAEIESLIGQRLAELNDTHPVTETQP